MNANEKYVREWLTYAIVRDVREWRAPNDPNKPWEMALAGWDGMIFREFESEEACWETAAEYVTDRVEKIRQTIAQMILIGAQAVDAWKNMMLSDAWSDMRSEWARAFVQYQMIFFHKEGELSGLKRGMKE